MQRRLPQRYVNNMNKYLQVILVSIIAVKSYAVSLDGTWLEDKEKSFEWNSLHSKADTERLEKLRAIMGHMYITYKDGVMCQFFEPYTVKYNGKVTEVARLLTTLANYEVLEKNEFGFALKVTYENKTDAIDMLIYESERSHYGVRLTTEDFGMPGTRVYFKKVAPVKWGFDCGE